jgi:hypothetical protein
MKCAIRCESLLLQKTVEIFLRPHLSTFNEADIVISDKNYESKKPVLILNKPFTKEDIYRQIDHLMETLDASPLECKSNKWEKIEPKIEKLTSAYVKKMMEIIQEHYEGK